MTTTTSPGEATMDSPAPSRHYRRCGSFSPWRIAAIVAGFIIFWPIGLALLVWTLWGREIRQSPLGQKIAGARQHRGERRHRGFMHRQPDNTALAAYLAREQERLQAEQDKLRELVQAFDAFKQAERRTADQRAFDAFLQQRDEPAPADAAQPPVAGSPGAESRSQDANPSAGNPG